MRPMFHWAVHRIHAHVAITVLALLVERVIEHACADTWRNIQDDLRQINVLERKQDALVPVKFGARGGASARAG